MTEIIKNNKSMSLDFIDTGAPSAKSEEDTPVFGSLFSNVDVDPNNNSEDACLIENVYIEKNISEIIESFKNFGIEIEEDTLSDIRQLLLPFIRGLGLKEASEETTLVEDDFVKLKDLLQKLEKLLGSDKIKSDIQGSDKKILLDQIRMSLNKKVLNKDKGALNKNQDMNKSIRMEGKPIKESNSPLLHEDEKFLMKEFHKTEKIEKKVDLLKPTIDNSEKKLKQPPKQLTQPFTKNIKSLENETLNGVTPLKDSFAKVEKPQSFLKNKKQMSDKIEIPKGIMSKTISTSKDSMNSESFGKIYDGSLLKNEQATNSNNNNNNQSHFSFKSESNNKLIETLNMLSKNWGNKLIDKVEKSIINGNEKLEISLSPKSLGKLNITINMQDTLTRVNIVAESASAAALLGESEGKLSQMMEASGLKLSALQTATQQFGNNNGKNSKHRSGLKTNNDKKEKLAESNTLVSNQRQISTKEGLNLIA